MLAMTAHAEETHRRPIQIARKSNNSLKSFDEILNCQSLRSFAPDQHLFHEGDDDQNIYRIESGLVRLYRLLSDGRRQIISFRFAGDILGFETAAERHCSAEAVTDVKVRSLDQESTYRRLRDEPALASQLVGLLSRELENTTGQIALLNRRSAIEKLAAFILELRRRAKSVALEIDLQLSRTDIADFLGLTIETVSRNLTKLRVKRIIELPQVHRLIIVDIDRLEALAAGECERW